MKYVISHVDCGGAYKVSKLHAELMDAELVIKPNFKKIIKILSQNPDLVLCSAHHLCLKFAILKYVLSRSTKLWCVEHFVLPFILKYEFASDFKRYQFLLLIKINVFFGVRCIAIDEVSNRLRAVILNKNADLVIGNLVPNPTKGLVAHEYDIVWAGGLNKQKRWSETLDILIQWKKEDPTLKIVVCSYDQAEKYELDKMRDHNIEFRHDEANWTDLAPKFFFTSQYEGFPLALAEAMAAGMGIISWSRYACIRQLLDYYEGYTWVSHCSKPNIRNVLETSASGKVKDGALKAHRLSAVKQGLQGL